MAALPPPAPVTSFINQAAGAYGASPQILQGIAQRESGYSTGADPNLWDSNALKGTPSEGMYQFIQPTFNNFASQAKAANPAAWNGVPVDWHNWKAQALAASWGITHGHQGDWSTYGAASHAAGNTQPATAASGPSVAAAVAHPQLSPELSSLIGGIFADQPVVGSLIANHLSQNGSQGPSAAPQAIPGAQATVSPSAQGVISQAHSQLGDGLAKAAAYAHANGQPFDSKWCGDFVQSAFKAAGLTPPPARSVPALLAWGEQHGRTSNTPTPGSTVLFDWNGDHVPDHVGIVSGVNHGQVTEIGGNQSMGLGRGVTQDTFAANGPNILTYINPY